MPEGFQTQLSETVNKQRREGAPLLEAYLDASGRLAFRFTDEGGIPVAQPRVTTPGFVPPSLGITPPSSGLASTQPRITPQASDVLSGTIGDRGQAGESTSLGTPPALQTEPASRAVLSSIGMIPGFGLGTGFVSGMQALGLRGVVGGSVTPRVGTTEFQETVRLGDIGRAGFVNQTVPDPTGRISRAFATGEAAGEPEFDTALSMRDLDSMSSIGSSGGAFAEAGRGGFGEVGRGDRGDLGRGESPTGGDVEGTPF